MSTLRESVPAVARACEGDHCITCSDEGTPMRVVAIIGPGYAQCEAKGQRSEVMTDLVGEARVGDTLLVHAGAALVRLQEVVE